MRSTIDQLHENAKQHSMRAVELMKRSEAVREEARNGTISGEEAQRRSAELQQRADDESRKASNMMKFLQSYEKPASSGPRSGRFFPRSFVLQPN